MAGFIVVARSAISFSDRPKALFNSNGNRIFQIWDTPIGEPPESFPIYEKAYEIAKYYPDYKITLMHRPNLEEFILNIWEQQVQKPGYIMTPDDDLILESRYHTEHPWAKDLKSPWYKQT